MADIQPLGAFNTSLSYTQEILKGAKQGLHTMVRGVGVGAYSSVDLCKRVMKGVSSRHLCAVKTYLLDDLRRDRCAVYGRDRQVALLSGISQVEREVDILTKLGAASSSHIVHLEEVISRAGSIRLVLTYAGAPVMTFMEHLHAYSARVISESGGSLYRSPPPSKVRVFAEGDAAAILRQLLDALVCLRAHGVVHKDVKPENVLIDFPVCRWRDPACPQTVVRAAYDHERPINITLCDFNTAELLPDGRIFDAQGTVLFSPPEVFGRIDPTAGVDGFARDIWSAGMLAFCLLVGLHPIPAGTSPLELQLNILQVNNIPLPDWIENQSLKSVVESMLHVDPAARVPASSALEQLIV